MIFRVNRWPWLVLALAAYYLPWVYHRAAALTFNANDLAEWTSLAPVVRDAGIPFLVPFLLRMVLAFLALLFALSATCAHKPIGRWGFALLAILLAITLLPPPEFFRGAWNDANYRQQFGIALATTLGLIAVVVLQRRSQLQRYQRRLEIALLLFTAICAIVGDIMALNVVRSYQIDASVGGGMIVLVICLSLDALVLMRDS